MSASSSSLEDDFKLKLNKVLLKTHSQKNSKRDEITVDSIEIPDFQQIADFFKNKQIGNDYEIQQFGNYYKANNDTLSVLTFDFGNEKRDDSKYKYYTFSLPGTFENNKITINNGFGIDYDGLVSNSSFQQRGEVGKSILLKIGLKVPNKSLAPVSSASIQPLVDSPSISNPKKSNDKIVEESIKYYKKLLVKLGLETKSITVSGHKANVLMFMMLMKTKLETMGNRNTALGTCTVFLKEGAVFRTARRLYSYIHYYEKMVAGKTDNYSMIIQLILYDLKNLCTYNKETPLKENLEYYKVRKIEENYIKDLKLDRDAFLQELSTYTVESVKKSIDPGFEESVETEFKEAVKAEVGEYDTTILTSVQHKFSSEFDSTNSCNNLLETQTKDILVEIETNDMTIAQREILYNTKCKQYLQHHIDLLKQDDSTLKEKGATNYFTRIKDLNKLHDDHVAKLKQDHGLEKDTQVTSVKKLNSKIGVVKLLTELSDTLKKPGVSKEEIFEKLSPESISWGTKLGYWTFVAIPFGQAGANAAHRALTKSGQKLFDHITSYLGKQTQGSNLDIEPYENPLHVQSLDNTSKKQYDDFEKNISGQIVSALLKNLSKLKEYFPDVCVYKEVVTFEPNELISTEVHDLDIFNFTGNPFSSYSQEFLETCGDRLMAIPFNYNSGFAIIVIQTINGTRKVEQFHSTDEHLYKIVPVIKHFVEKILSNKQSGGEIENPLHSTINHTNKGTVAVDVNIASPAIQPNFEFIKPRVINGSELWYILTRLRNTSKSQNTVSKEFEDFKKSSFEIKRNLITELIKDSRLLNTIDDDKIGIHEKMCNAASEGKLEDLKNIINTNNNISLAECPNKLTPLYMASFNGHKEVVEFLLEKGADVNQGITEDGATPLIAALESGHLDVFNLLLKKNADTNKARTDGATPLFIASSLGKKEYVDILLTTLADINQARTADGATPLIVALNNEHLDVSELLLEKKADINKARTDDGATPLIVALEKKYLDGFKLLLEKNADINKARTDDGATPLIIATQEGLKNIVKLLVDKGADLTLKDNKGYTAFDYANDNEIKNILTPVVSAPPDQFEGLLNGDQSQMQMPPVLKYDRAIYGIPSTVNDVEAQINLDKWLAQLGLSDKTIYEIKSSVDFHGKPNLYLNIKQHFDDQQLLNSVQQIVGNQVTPVGVNANSNSNSNAGLNSNVNLNSNAGITPGLNANSNSNSNAGLTPGLNASAGLNANTTLSTNAGNNVDSNPTPTPAIQAAEEAAEEAARQAEAARQEEAARQAEAARQEEAARQAEAARQEEAADAATKIQTQIRRKQEMKRFNYKIQQKQRENHIVDELGNIWRTKMEEAINKGFLTNTNKTAGEKLLGEGVFNEQLKILKDAGVKELKTFWSKIPPVAAPDNLKFDELVTKVATKLDTFTDEDNAIRDTFVLKIKTDFKIDKLTDGSRLLQFKQKDNDCLDYWLEISKDNPDDTKLFDLFKPEYYIDIDFKEYVLVKVYGFMDLQANKLLKIFSNFLVLCHMLEYMSANPETMPTKYINMFTKMNLSEGTVKIEETDTTKSEVTMFRLFKELLARGIATSDMQIIHDTNSSENKDYVEIVLISFMYLVFSEPVFIEITGWTSTSYNAYSYTDFLKGLQPELIKINSDSYIKAAINLISKCYYKNDQNTQYLVSEKKHFINNIDVDDIYVVNTVLNELAKVNNLTKTVNKQAAINKGMTGGKRIDGKRIDGKRIDGKRIDGKRIDGKMFTRKIIKKSPLNKRNAKTTKKNKHLSPSSNRR